MPPSILTSLPDGDGPASCPGSLTHKGQLPVPTTGGGPDAIESRTTAHARNQTPFPSHPVRNSVTILTQLSRLLYRTMQITTCQSLTLKFTISNVDSVIPLLTHTATSSTPFRHFCKYRLTKTTKLSLLTAFRLLNIRVSGDFESPGIMTETKPLHFEIRTLNSF